MSSSEGTDLNKLSACLWEQTVPISLPIFSFMRYTVPRMEFIFHNSYIMLELLVCAKISLQSDHIPSTKIKIYC
jgi:hypothetical protein